MTRDGLPDEADSDDDEMDVDFKPAESSKSESVFHLFSNLL